MTEKQKDIEITITEDNDEAAEKKIKHDKPHKTTQKKRSTAQKKIIKKFKEQADILQRVIKERDEYQDKYLRSLAEVDNFRKRVKKEKEEYQRYVLGEFLLDLLDVYDNLERALKTKVPGQEKPLEKENEAGDENSLVSGVEMIFKQLAGLLKKNNVEEIEALNRTFDPNLHQALSKVEQRGIEESVVLEVYQKGFVYNGKLLRPALTRVAIPKVESEDEANGPGDENPNIEG